MEIKIVNNIIDLKKVWHLTYIEYLRVGYCEENREKTLIHYPHLDLTTGGLYPNTTVYIIEEKGEVIGTISLTLDGPFGLHTDVDWHEEVEEYRNKYEKIASSWRIVVKEHTQKRVVFQLIDLAYNWFVDNDIDAILFTFNPKHKNFYKRFVGLEIIGSHKLQHGLINAPAILMIGDKYTICWNKYRSMLL